MPPFILLTLLLIVTLNAVPAASLPPRRHNKDASLGSDIPHAPPIPSRSSTPPPDDDPIYPNCTAATVVHVVFSNHFDLGYRAYQPDGDFASQVMDQAINVWIPRALQFESDMRSFNSSVNAYNDTFVWMTQPYVLSNALDCPPHMNFTCLNATVRAQLVDAMVRGAITWHAFPYNSEAELHSADLFEAAIELSHSLSDQLGLPRPLTISQRDVPGTTKAIIPLLVKHGIRAFSIGANGWPTDAIQYGPILRWRITADDPTLETLMLYHPGRYGGILVKDAIIVPNFPHILITDWGDDNQGPATAETYLADLTAIRARFPGCQVRVASFDDYVTPLYTAVQRGELPQIPIITAEMGDTWI